MNSQVLLRARASIPTVGSSRNTISGSLIKVLFDGRRIKGRYEVVWDGTDGDGRTVASGAYFCRMVAGSDESTAKMILVR